MESNVTYERDPPMDQTHFIHRPVEIIRQVLRRWLSAREQRRAELALLAMPDYLLRDMGMDRHQLEVRIASQSQLIKEASPNATPIARGGEVHAIC